MITHFKCRRQISPKNLKRDLFDGIAIGKIKINHLKHLIYTFSTKQLLNTNVKTQIKKTINYK